MAQNPPSPGHPGRQLIVLALTFVFLFGLMLFAGTSNMSWTERLEPKLGLDLVGGTRVALQAVTEGGGAPAEDQLERARQIISSRVNALGVEEAEVVAEGEDLIVISVAGEAQNALRSVGDPAELRYRKVLAITAGAGAPPTPTETPAPSGSPSAEQSPAPSGSPSAQESPGASGTPSAQESPAAQDSPAAQSPTPSPGPGDGETDLGTEEQRRQEVLDIVGQDAMEAALGLTAPPDLSQDPALAEQLEPFGELTGAQAAVLPAKVQYNVPTVSCEQLNARPAGSVREPEQLAVACPQDGQPIKYLLDSSTVLGTAVDDANAVLDPQTNQWLVSISFNSEGQAAWTELTRESVNNQQATPLDQSMIGEDNGYAGGRPIQCDQVTAIGQSGNCLVAVVLDNQVVSAPEILSVIGGDAQITGDFTATEARELATSLRYGALPLTFEEQESQTITPTLGTEYLRAGLIAAGIGMALVLLYSFFYYRLLGIVIFGSLVISSLLIYAALVVLGRSIGFTLTLAGISGFIVAVGIAADSFVIYFERLKDEIRDGRTPRSGVARAWVRARRTIISANAVTFLAALVLYILAAGQVRGFAFALGLATLLDLLVVFTFRHPIMTLLARTRAFLSPTVSGLGRALELERGTGAAGGPRAREA